MRTNSPKIIKIKTGLLSFFITNICFTVVHEARINVCLIDCFFLCDNCCLPISDHAGQLLLITLLSKSLNINSIAYARVEEHHTFVYSGLWRMKSNIIILTTCRTSFYTIVTNKLGLREHVLRITLSANTQILLMHANMGKPMLDSRDNFWANFQIDDYTMILTSINDSRSFRDHSKRPTLFRATIP